MLYALVRPILFLFSPEVAHTVTLHSLALLSKAKLLKKVSAAKEEPVEVMGLRFPNKVGLAAGLDKNGEYIDALSHLGFGFLEIGTVTPRPQSGNPKPRLFRLPKANALINRMGFNNHGIDYMIEKVKKAKYTGILGVNIGKNFDTSIEKAVEDYLICMEKAYPYASYITVNISSPNTPNLRNLQHEAALNNLLGCLKEKQAELKEMHKKYVPIAIKIAPDLSEREIKDISRIFLQQKIDCVISSNTTLSRTGVASCKYSDEKGGLSGAPLFKQSLHNISILNDALQKQIPIIACGGIMNAENAQALLDAGASLVQVYTGLIYQGPVLIKECININT